MATELLQIDPPQLTFTFELKKQSSCLVHLINNNSSHHVAFKVKTTSPKKYCVRPTVGIVKPHGTCDFTVTMQAQRTAPPDLHCKDKFLVQSAVVPKGTTEDEISSDLFVKDSGRLVDEKKLRVVLINSPSSPVNGDLKQDPPSQMLPSLTAAKGMEAAQDMEEDGADKGTFPSTRSVEKVGDMKQVNDAVNLSFATKDSEELKSRLSIMDAKLREAEGTIMKLNEERRRNIREKDLLKQELEMLKKKIKMKRAQEGFPLLFVCVVSIVSMAVGYYIHP
ncbi:hypothetical protein GYH30_041887 [Glycine max]|nr:hypothetical protein GYH30_041887 [Glycine max]